jgi:hypothetical protein
MADLPVIDATNFKELHLLPRVLFTIGGIAFVGAFYAHSLSIGLIGLATLLFGVGLNLIIDAVMAPKLWKWGIVQAIVCTLTAGYLTFFVVHHRPMPSCTSVPPVSTETH